MPIITLLTDFGNHDWYVGSMRGVILATCSEARLVDITHVVPNHDIRSAAYILHNAHRCFPEGTIHLAVVDPGVGTSRRPLVIRSRRYLFVGPDNGIFTYVTTGADVVSVHEIANERYMLPRTGQTFHARDIFAPVAAHLARGVAPEEFGPRVEQRLEEFDVVVPTETTDGRWRGQVMHIDRFGNAITNLAVDLLVGVDRRRVAVEVGDAEILAVCACYGDREPGESLATVSSSGCIEIAVNGGNAAYRFGLSIGDIVFMEVRA